MRCRAEAGILGGYLLQNLINGFQLGVSRSIRELIRPVACLSYHMAVAHKNAAHGDLFMLQSFLCHVEGFLHPVQVLRRLGLRGHIPSLAQHGSLLVGVEEGLPFFGLGKRLALLIHEV